MLDVLPAILISEEESLLEYAIGLLACLADGDFDPHHKHTSE